MLVSDLWRVGCERGLWRYGRSDPFPCPGVSLVHLLGARTPIHPASAHLPILYSSSVALDVSFIPIRNYNKPDCSFRLQTGARMPKLDVSELSGGVDLPSACTAPRGVRSREAGQFWVPR